MFVNFLLDNIWGERGFKVWVITPLPRFLIAIVIVTSELYAKMLRCCCHKKKQFANDMMDKNTSCYYYFLLQVKDYWIYSFTPTFDHNFISTRDKIHYISNNINIYIYIYTFWLIALLPFLQPWSYSLYIWHSLNQMPIELMERYPA